MRDFDKIHDLIDARIDVLKIANGRDLNFAIRVHKAGTRSEFLVKLLQKITAGSATLPHTPS